MAAPNYKLAIDEDFDSFVRACTDHTGWSLVYEEADTGLKVWDQKASDSAINIVKLYAEFKGIPALTLYDVLHDPEYRSTWDENMIEGHLIEQLDPYNDVGYYSAKVPSPVANRDWVNQRMWREKPSTEYVIMNHSVPHEKMPEKKGFVRANSIMSGYYVLPLANGSCSLTYLTQNDPRGWIPSWLVNKVTKSFAPKIVEKLDKAAKAYEEWKGKQPNPNQKPWRKEHIEKASS